MKVLYLLLLAIILAVFLGGCVSEPKDGFNSQRIGNRIVYTTDAGANVEILKKDCGRLGGWFNECGSTGTAAAVCAFTCELEYVACGCGCCGGVEPAENNSCVSNLQEIVEEDRKFAGSPDCVNAGCSLG